MFLRSLPFVLSGLMLAAAPLAAAEQVFDIRDNGAVPDGKTLCTQAIQKAIDQCHDAGGGTVYFPPGKWLSGTIFLKNNVTLHLENGATLLGSGDLKDYPEYICKLRSYTDNYVKRSLIVGEDLHDIGLRGRGTIDGQGGKFLGKPYFERPYLIRFISCRDVLVEDLFLRDSAMWMQHYLACDRVTLRGVRVFNHINRNNDGMDIDSCSDVFISDCNLDTEDDALCLKACAARPSQFVNINNCVLSSHANALKMGTESMGGFRNITIANCTIMSPRFSRHIMSATEQRGRTGIDLLMVDGGTLENVTISNITMDGIHSPIFMRLGDVGRAPVASAPKPPVGALRNVVISNIVATNISNHGCAILGIPGYPIENVTLSNIRVEYEGGGTAADAGRKLPQLVATYPKSTMFQTAMPAYGLFARNVKGLRLSNVQFTLKQPDARPAALFEAVEDLTIDGKQ
jgi:polygalacturonase